MYYPPYNRKKFLLLVTSINKKILSHLQTLDKDIFTVHLVGSVDEACALVEDNQYSIIIADEPQHKSLNEKVENNIVSLILITNIRLDLKNRFFSLIPESLFIGTHTDEFIFASIEKTYLRFELDKQRKKRERFCEILRRFEEFRASNSYDRGSN